MAQFPITRSQETISGQTSNVPIGNIGGSSNAIAQGLEKLGGAFEKMAQAKQNMDYSTYRRQFHEVTYSAINAHRASNDPKKMKEIEDNWTEYADSFGNDNPDFVAYKNNILPSLGQTFASQTATFQAQSLDDEFGLNYEKLVEQNDYKGIEILVGQAHKDGILSVRTPAQAEDMLNRANKTIGMSIVLNQAVATGNKQEALDVVGKSGLSVEDRMKLDNKVADYFAQSELSAAQKRINDTRIFYEDAVDKIQNNTLTADDIELSNITQDDKDNWKEFLKGSFETPQTKSVASSYDQLTKVVLAYSRKQITLKEATDRILKERYGNNLVSDEDFQWALDKLKNPYPKHLVSKIEGMLESTKEQMRSTWDLRKTELKKAGEANRKILEQEITEDLFDWIDSQDKEPSAKEIFKHLQETQLAKHNVIKKIQPESKIEQSPFEDYPDAYKEDGNWYVIIEGNRYRIEE